MIKKNSIKKNEINWNKIEAAVRDSINSFESDENVYDAIAYMIELIDDGHSQFVKPNVLNRLDINTFSIPKIETRLIHDNIGYLKVPGFMANDSLSHLFALEVRKSLLELDSLSKILGWIIDLRGNNGGKGSSMLLGVSPLFQDSLVGYSLNNEGEFNEIYCTNHFKMKRSNSDSLIHEFQLRNKNLKIAILVDKRTGSAGELLALALKAQEKSQIIGERTKGQTSHLGLIEFSKSNAKLLLAMWNYCDNKKNVINGSISPDIECAGNESLNVALEWVAK